MTSYQVKCPRCDNSGRIDTSRRGPSGRRLHTKIECPNCFGAGVVVCKHCREPVRKDKRCKTCYKDYSELRQCGVCHREVVHDLILDQNIRICGSTASRLDLPENDPDAFGRSDWHFR